MNAMTRFQLSASHGTAAPGLVGMRLGDLSAHFGEHTVFRDVSMTIRPGTVTALIGPSGCGKSTLLRCLNGMHLRTAGAGVSGSVELDGQDVYATGMPVDQLRRRVGMVFQRPNPFPTMSIYDNVIAGLILGGRRRGRDRSYDDVVERALTHAGLWNEVKDRLSRAGGALSGGQQQRLCIARTLAVGPEVLLMDEPCSALDPISTLAIEDTISELKRELTVVIVTHNLQQAARVSDSVAFMTISEIGAPGRLIEFGTAEQIFNSPTVKATEDYISGRVG